MPRGCSSKKRSTKNSRSGKMKAKKKGSNKNRDQDQSKATAQGLIPQNAVDSAERQTGLSELQAKEQHTVQTRHEDQKLPRPIAHSRARSNSLPIYPVDHSESNTEIAHLTRAEAISLIRSRTVNRTSEFGHPSQLLQGPVKNNTSFSEQPQSEVPSDTMVYEHASLLDFAKAKKANRNRRKKGKKVDENYDIFAEGPAGESSKDHDNSSLLPIRAKDDPFTELETGNKAEVGADKTEDNEISVDDETLDMADGATLEVHQEHDQTVDHSESQANSVSLPAPSSQTDPTEIDTTDETEASTAAKKKNADCNPDVAVSMEHNDESSVVQGSSSHPATETEGNEPAEPEAPVEAAATPDEQETHEKAHDDGEEQAKGKQRVADITQLLPQPSSAPEMSESLGAAEEMEVPKSPDLEEVKYFTPSPQSKNANRKRSSSMSTIEEKLSPIIEGQTWNNTAVQSPEKGTPTPKSSAAASSTGWTLFSNTGAQTPQTSAPSAPSTSQRSKPSVPISSQAVVTTPSSSEGNPGAIRSSSHAHPTPSAASGPATGNDSEAEKLYVHVPRERPPGFIFDMDKIGFLCAKPDCYEKCDLRDGRSVICPHCGPYSKIRYCSHVHLFEDIKGHYNECRVHTFEHPCKIETIPESVRDGPPLIPCYNQYDTPERRRQAIYFNINRQQADYFVFSDWVDYEKDGSPADDLKYRCSGRVIYNVRFTDPEEKDRFRRVLAASLFMTIKFPNLQDYMYRMLRDKINSLSQLPHHRKAFLLNQIRLQMHQEFAWTLVPMITGNRHACPTDWNGRNRTHCRDPVCRSEFNERFVLAWTPGNGHKKRLDELEACYWILRANRTTHPDPEVAAAKPRERAMGKGFPDVQQEDKVDFWWGDGWEIFGEGGGEMDIEGLNMSNFGDFD